MKIEFDSLGELQDFLKFAGYVRNHDIPMLEMLPLSSENRARLLNTFGMPRAELDASNPATDLDTAIANAAAAIDSVAPGAGLPPQTEAEPPKRKRRTKAEIEADKAAAAANVPIVETPAPSDAQAAAATSPLAGANPFDASTSNAPAETAALNEAPAGTTGALSALGEQTGYDPIATATAEILAGAVASGAAVEAPLDPQAFIELRVAEMGGTFDPREHMKKCVEFIGALGKAKYDEAFTLAGTSRSVATYTPADCAKHIAALEYLQLSVKSA